MRTVKTSNKDSARTLWGIYFTDREYAREVGDPLRTVIAAISKDEAEREAERLGFHSAWAHPVTAEEAGKVQWRPENVTPREIKRTKSRFGIRV